MAEREQQLAKHILFSTILAFGLMLLPGLLINPLGAIFLFFLAMPPALAVAGILSKFYCRVFAKSGHSAPWIYIWLGVTLALPLPQLYLRDYSLSSAWFYAGIPGLAAGIIFWTLSVKPLRESQELLEESEGVRARSAQSSLFRNSLALALGILSFSATFYGELKGLFYQGLYTKEELVLKQLSGEGCGIGSYSGSMFFREPNLCAYRAASYPPPSHLVGRITCAVRAAECAAELPIDPHRVLPALHHIQTQIERRNSSLPAAAHFPLSRLSEAIDKLEEVKEG